MTQVGSRVGALLGVEQANKVVKVLGYGKYVGNFVPDETATGDLAEIARKGHMPNPKIELDDGKVVWGCECWWGPEDRIKRDLATYEQSGFTIKQVDIDVVRREVSGAPVN